MTLTEPNLTCEPFSALTAADVYQILRLRSAVFVLEQNCAYQDIDDLDSAALHLMYQTPNELLAYARILSPSQTNSPYCSIGRVVVKATHRQHKIGRELMQAAIKTCLKHHHKAPIKIAAQTYLSHFYQSLGFVNTGHYYLEDDIPHQTMVWQSPTTAQQSD